MRIGASILMNREVACQSHEWQIHRPIGSLNVALQALNRLEVDEIAVINIGGRAEYGSGAAEASAFLSNIPVTTPVIFGGGIDEKNFRAVVANASADRYLLSSSLIEGNFDCLEQLAEIVGLQAIIGCLPFRLESGRLRFFHTGSAQWVELSPQAIAEVYTKCDEVLWYDTGADGQKEGFDLSVLKSVDIELNRTIICGGVGEKELKWARSRNLAACYIENRILHKEQTLRH